VTEAAERLFPVLTSFRDDLQITNSENAAFEALEVLARSILDRQNRLNTWCNWIDIKRRAINVAITRATTEVVGFASFDASMIDLTRTSARAVHDLKQYLDFAERGPIALGEAIVSVGGSDLYDSDFEFTVAEGLRRHGWTVHTQIGVSKFRIDLGIVHPDKPGAYLAGVECDGAAYHSLPSARDRDRVRHIILERLGWRLTRIWSTDFFLDSNRVLKKVHEELIVLLEENRSQSVKSQLLKPDEETATEQPVADDFTSRVDADLQPERIARESTQREETHKIDVSTEIDALSSAMTDEAILACAPELTERIDARVFYEPDYAAVIAELSAFHIDTFGPITFKHLSERVARIHGFKRTGSEIKSRVWAEVHRLRTHSRDLDGQTTLWPKGMEPVLVVRFRGMKIGQMERSWADVPYTEKLGLAAEVIAAGGSGDAVEKMAERIGLIRLVGKTRDQLGALLAEASNGVNQP